MGDTCDDNRFELIEKYKQALIESTNIETSKAEMDVIDNVLFRFWQAGWLDKLEKLQSVQPMRKKGKWTTEDCHAATYRYCCSNCKAHHRARYGFCPSCGAEMEGRE